jgi:hypothetical protein
MVRALPKAEHRLELSDMVSFKFLLDHDVRHLATSFPGKQVLMLEDVGLSQRSSDGEIVEAASERGCVIVTNNARDFEKEVPEHIAATSKKAKGCAQVHGLVIVIPPEKFVQEKALSEATGTLTLEGRSIGWKEVSDLCLKVVISKEKRPVVTKLPRCPYCKFGDED